MWSFEEIHAGEPAAELNTNQLLKHADVVLVGRGAEEGGSKETGVIECSSFEQVDMIYADRSGHKSTFPSVIISMHFIAMCSFCCVDQYNYSE